MTEATTEITAVDTAAKRSVLHDLLRDYHRWLREVVPHSHDPEAGLATDIRSQEREPESWAWVARFDGTPAGCVLLYGETDDLAEFRRLWVTPDYRGHGTGRRLLRTVIEQARTQGYGTLGLTTPPAGEAAHALYESEGFERTPPYPETRLDEQHHEDAIFMQLDLGE